MAEEAAVAEATSPEVRVVPVSLARKLLAARKLVLPVKASGRNESQRYDYVPESAIAAEARRVLDEAGVITLVDVEQVEQSGSVQTSNNRTLAILRAWVRVTFVDAETGESWSCRFPGEGMDAGDKAGYKAITGALKYALAKNLLIATNDDPERDDRDRADRKRNTEPLQRPQADPLKGGSEYITREQKQAFWRIARGAGHSDPKVVEWLATENILNSAMIPRKRFAELCKTVGKPQLPEKGQETTDATN